HTKYKNDTSHHQTKTAMVQHIPEDTSHIISTQQSVDQNLELYSEKTLLKSIFIIAKAFVM
ncbi:MAG: hypothetical protein RQ760_00630, partial [Sedimentisphaerales bacterium]|nr:hypothetical protein [Sedimentisphaerales bacterium]